MTSNKEKVYAWIKAPMKLSGILERSSSIIAALIGEMSEDQLEQALANAKQISSE